jgi:hypothetical protein
VGAGPVMTANGSRGLGGPNLYRQGESASVGAQLRKVAGNRLRTDSTMADSSVPVG